MPDLPQLALIQQCPDSDCRAQIGQKHQPGCLVAICVTTGQQRILHGENPPPPADLPIDADVHICGTDVWTGRPHGTDEAAEHGLYVRPAAAADSPLTGWIPCQPGEAGAVPDLDRVVRAGRWNPIRQMFELGSEVRHG